MLVLRLQHVSSRFSDFLVASPCLCGKLQNLPFANVFNQVVMSFCVGGVVLRDILTCLQKCRKSLCVAGAILLASFAKDALHFSWQVQHFGDLHRHFAWRVCAIASSGSNVQITWQAWDIVRVSFCVVGPANFPLGLVPQKKAPTSPKIFYKMQGKHCFLGTCGGLFW